MREVLRLGQLRVEALAGDDVGTRTWTNTIDELDEIARWVSERIGPVGHLLGVNETSALRDAYNAVLPEVSGFWTRLPLNSALWEKIKGYAATEEARQLSGIRRRHLDKTLLEFRRAGADLPVDGKARLEEIKLELAQAERKFSEHVLDATAAWELHVTEADRLTGVPEAPIARFRVAADERGLAGWLLTLDYPSVEPILKYASDRELRQTVHHAYVTRCREGEFDNRGSGCPHSPAQTRDRKATWLHPFRGLPAGRPHGEGGTEGPDLPAGHGRPHPHLLEPGRERAAGQCPRARAGRPQALGRDVRAAVAPPEELRYRPTKRRVPTSPSIR